MAIATMRTESNGVALTFDGNPPEGLKAFLEGR
jgi:hypothetical protein